ncbi:hypothetical protein [Chitinophaga barathri]|uniref:Uncharacterized protein n=1 Tax=Chitinophaga barathri TaxID=1647451 RepID=A0A3N4MJ57_9BACT|nr:hypothetical protein [Chitinophaga barathri]RPD41847.1 hypothetical protein EG028_06695 [Chitinophaga barathri]
MKKYSILGLALMAVSAITAAFVPSKQSLAAGQVVDDGHITLSSGAGPENTCRTALTGDAIDCSHTQTGNNVANNALSSTSANVQFSNSISDDAGAETGTSTEP